MSRVAVYEPPREGLPYLVVTVKDGGITSYTPVATKQEARDMLAAVNIGKSGSVLTFTSKADNE